MKEVTATLSDHKTKIHKTMIIKIKIVKNITQEMKKMAPPHKTKPQGNQGKCLHSRNVGLMSQRRR